MNNKLSELNKVFGSYRAEWLKNKIFDYFSEPAYFTGLLGNRPCVLQGGRGTGKTTVLMGLSYQGQFDLNANNIKEFDKLDYIGIYLRIDTNHVRAFDGKGLDDSRWQDFFAHYFNLVICFKILKFLRWHKSMSPEDEVLSDKNCNIIARSLLFNNLSSSFEELYSDMETEMYTFQSHINNIASLQNLELSLAGDPIKLITNKVLELRQFNGKMFYLLLDEYENLLDSQQVLINTLIKHSPQEYTFKIGVRELGWRKKHTKNEMENLYEPADYILICIEKFLSQENRFEDFAYQVCQKRIAVLVNNGENEYEIKNSLQNLSMEDEAELLKVSETNFIREYERLDSKHRDIVDGLSQLYKFFISYWAKVHNESLEEEIEKYANDKKCWNTRYDNYKYSMLFKIRKGRGMVGIQKYYSGWDTYLKLANCNIRFLMELVYTAYEKHLNKGFDLNQPVGAAIQTEAAREVGKKNIEELEGFWEHGADMTRLLYGLGRMFNSLARSSGKLRPEVDQISLEGVITPECSKIVSASVMNQALIRLEGNKPNNIGDTKEYIYMVHPIYSAYFVYSYRRKRKMSITVDEFMNIIRDPEHAIEAVLSKKSEEILTIESSKQLTLFMDEDYD